MHHHQVAGSFRIAVGITMLCAVNTGMAYSPGPWSGGNGGGGNGGWPGANHAPWINGTPAKSATVNSPYSFQPQAGDVDGQTVRFSIVGRPAWATFSTTTGLLAGTPPAWANGKTFSGISIRASDGQLTRALPSFGISVLAPVSGTATLQWEAPTRNVDGSLLTNLAGYKVAYGTSPGDYSQTLSIPAPMVTSVVVEGLATDTRWYFAVKAVNTAGVESAFSSAVSKLL